jgi:hypothetical protein
MVKFMKNRRKFYTFARIVVLLLPCCFIVAAAFPILRIYSAAIIYSIILDRNIKIGYSASQVTIGKYARRVTVTEYEYGTSKTFTELVPLPTGFVIKFTSWPQFGDLKLAAYPTEVITSKLQRLRHNRILIVPRVFNGWQASPKFLSIDVYYTPHTALTPSHSNPEIPVAVVKSLNWLRKWAWL